MTARPNGLRPACAVLSLLASGCAEPAPSDAVLSVFDEHPRLTAAAAFTCVIRENGEPRCWGLIGHSNERPALAQLPLSPRHWNSVSMRGLPEARVVAGFRSMKAHMVIRHGDGACFHLDRGDWGCVDSIRGFSLREGKILAAMDYPQLRWPSWQSCEPKAGWLECVSHDETVRRTPLSSRIAAVLENARFACMLLRGGELHCAEAKLDLSATPRRETTVELTSTYSLALSTPPIATGVAQASIDAGAVSWIDSSGAWWMLRGAEHRWLPTVVPFTMGASAAPFVSLASSLDESCARASDGTVWCVTRDQRAARRVVDESLEIAAGARHVCALLRGDVVKCWGDPTLGRLGMQNSGAWIAGRVALDEPVRSASAGWGHSCVVLRSGRVSCWGLRDVENTESTDAGIGESIGARYRAVSVPAEIPAARGATAIASRGSTSCVRRASDRWCWRGADGAALRSVSVDEYAARTQTEFRRNELLDVGFDITEGCAGFDYRCLLLRSGDVHCSVPWCSRPVHSLSSCGAPGEVAPVSQLPGHMVGLTCGGEHACAWNAAGDLFCWGSDVFAQRASSVDRDSRRPRAVSVALTTDSPRATP